MAEKQPERKHERKSSNASQSNKSVHINEEKNNQHEVENVLSISKTDSSKAISDEPGSGINTEEPAITFCTNEKSKNSTPSCSKSGCTKIKSEKNRRSSKSSYGVLSPFRYLKKKSRKTVEWVKRVYGDLTTKTSENIISYEYNDTENVTAHRDNLNERMIYFTSKNEYAVDKVLPIRVGNVKLEIPMTDSSDSASEIYVESYHVMNRPRKRKKKAAGKGSKRDKTILRIRRSRYRYRNSARRKKQNQFENLSNKTESLESKNESENNCRCPCHYEHHD